MKSIYLVFTALNLLLSGVFLLCYFCCTACLHRYKGSCLCPYSSIGWELNCICICVCLFRWAPLAFSLGTLKRAWLHPLCTLPPGVHTHWEDSFEPSLLPDWAVKPLLKCQMFQPLFGTSLLAQDHLPQSAGSTFPDAAQGNPECKGPSHVQHSIHQDPKSTKFCPPRCPIGLYWCMVLFLPRSRTWHFAELYEVTIFFFLARKSWSRGFLSSRPGRYSLILR